MREKSVKRTFDKARAVAREAVSKLPASTVRGFHDGRQVGHDFIENAPYLAGGAAGLVYGAGEAVIGLAASAIGWAWAGEEEGAAETA